MVYSYNKNVYGKDKKQHLIKGDMIKNLFLFFFKNIISDCLLVFASNVSKQISKRVYKTVFEHKLKYRRFFLCLFGG